MTNSVWVSSALTDAELILPLTADIVVRDEARAIDATRKNNHGEALPGDQFPQAVWVDDGARLSGGLPDFFMAQGYWLVSARAADAIRQHDLGGGNLYPVAVLQKDRRTAVPGAYFCINFGNVRKALAPEASTNLRPFGVAGLRWNLPSMPKDGDIAVHEAALNGVGMWVDSALFKGLFVSEALGRSLVDAGLRRAFRLHACRII